MPENHTSPTVLHIRIVSLPAAGEFDEFDLSRFSVGNTYEVPMRLASLLLIAGHAEMVPSRVERAEAADHGHRFRRRKDRKEGKGRKD